MLTPSDWVRPLAEALRTNALYLLSMLPAEFNRIYSEK